jgi:hypothetical protein
MEQVMAGLQVIRQKGDGGQRTEVRGHGGRTNEGFITTDKTGWARMIKRGIIEWGQPVAGLAEGPPCGTWAVDGAQWSVIG